MISQVTRKHDFLLYHSPPVVLASLLLVPEASLKSIMKRCNGRGVLAWVIIRDRGGDHHQHPKGKTKVCTRHKPLEGVLLPQSSP